MTKLLIIFALFVLCALIGDTYAVCMICGFDSNVISAPIGRACFAAQIPLAAIAHNIADGIRKAKP